MLKTTAKGFSSEFCEINLFNRPPPVAASGYGSVGNLFQTKRFLPEEACITPFICVIFYMIALRKVSIFQMVLYLTRSNDQFNKNQ